MQNFIECAKGHYITSRKLCNSILKCNVGRQSGLGRLSATTCRENGLGRLHTPASRNSCQEFCKAPPLIDSSIIKYAVRNAYKLETLPRLCSIRFFSTTRVLTASEDDKKGSDDKPGENKGQSDKDKKSQEDPNKKDQNGKEPKNAVPLLIHLMILTTGLLVVFFINTYRQIDDVDAHVLNIISWNEFSNKMLSKGEVESIVIYPDRNMVKIILHKDAIIDNKLTRTRTYYMVIPDHATMEEKIRQAEDRLHIPYHQRVPIIYERVPDRVKFLNGMIWVGILLILLMGLFSKPASILREIGKMNPRMPKFTLVEPTTGKGIRFSDVAGMTEAKVEVMEFVDYLKSPERYRVLGAKVPKGALLLGPPGCGKTMLAKAVATESNVPFMSMNGCEFIEMFGGLGAARVRNLFQEAKRRAPSIIYIDEIDAFGKTRQSSNVQDGTSEVERTLIQLLVEMDGMTTQDDIVIIASTNRAHVLDKALLRRGRFDRHILIDLPTQIERKEIFEKHLACLSLEHEPSHYSEYLASISPGFSGADIANVCNEAALHAARLNKKKVYGSDLLYAMDRTRRGAVKSTTAMTPEETKVVAYREAGHALLAWLLQYTDPVAKVTIVPTTSGALGHTETVQSLQRHNMTDLQMADVTCSILGSRISEQIVFGEGSDATREHLRTVTDLVYKQVARYGMSPAVGLVSFDPEEYKPLGRPFSKKLDSLIDSEVRRIIMLTSNRARNILTKNLNLLHTVAAELIKRETLYYEDLVKLIGPPPYHKAPPQIPESFIERKESKTT